MNIEDDVKKLSYWDSLSEEEKAVLMRGTTGRSYQKNEYIHDFQMPALEWSMFAVVLSGFIRLLRKEGRLLCFIYRRENAALCLHPA